MLHAKTVMQHKWPSPLRLLRANADARRQEEKGGGEGGGEEKEKLMLAGNSYAHQTAASWNR